MFTYTKRVITEEEFDAEFGGFLKNENDEENDECIFDEEEDFDENADENYVCSNCYWYGIKGNKNGVPNYCGLMKKATQPANSCNEWNESSEDFNG